MPLPDSIRDYPKCPNCGVLVVVMAPITVAIADPGTHEFALCVPWGTSFVLDANMEIKCGDYRCGWSGTIKDLREDT